MRRLAAATEGRPERLVSMAGERGCFRYSDFGGSFLVLFCLQRGGGGVIGVSQGVAQASFEHLALVLWEYRHKSPGQAWAES